MDMFQFTYCDNIYGYVPIHLLNEVWVSKVFKDVLNTLSQNDVNEHKYNMLPSYMWRMYNCFEIHWIKFYEKHFYKSMESDWINSQSIDVALIKDERQWFRCLQLTEVFPCIFEIYCKTDTGMENILTTYLYLDISRIIKIIKIFELNLLE